MTLPPKIFQKGYPGPRPPQLLAVLMYGDKLTFLIHPVWSDAVFKVLLFEKTFLEVHPIPSKPKLASQTRLHWKVNIILFYLFISNVNNLDSKKRCFAR